MQRAGYGSHHEDGYDAVPKQREKQQSKCRAEAAVGGANDRAAAVGPVPCAGWRTMHVHVGGDIIVGSQFGKPIGKVARPAIGHILRDVDVFAGNLPPAFGTHWRGHDVKHSAGRKPPRK
jgi:hypothetical protein